ncbi:NADH-quinone oxidoreductase subunit 5 family protein [Deinococcus sp. UYEF24]
MILLLPLAPLLASLLILLVGRARTSGWINLTGVLISLLTLVLIGTPAQVHGDWFTVGSLHLTLGLRLDGLSRLMVWLVTGVGSLVSVYALAYMKEEQGQPRFFAAFSFFLGAMLVLVMSTSTLLLYAAWEGVGAASYLLIGFWYARPEAVRAARRAFLLTRLGDLGLLLGWLLALRLTGSTEISGLLKAVGTLPASTVTLLALLFLAGAAGKSAQLPLTAWLPDAMAGPTPVSALLHSATMVAAGVYLLLRLEPLYAASPMALTVVAWLGGVTALFAALSATVQTDLKRVLAWSTVSQLGEMFLAFGLGAPLAASQHLTTHALFKSALFLTAGSVEHAAGTRELARLGGLAGRMPWTAAAFVAGGLTLAGLPPFGAFWSEDEILRGALRAGPWPAFLLLALIFLAGVYISRAAISTFWGPALQPSEAQEVSLALRFPALLLAVLGLGAGLLGPLVKSAVGSADGPALPLSWVFASVLCSVAGLLFGGWRAARAGAAPAPAFGHWAGWTALGLEAATHGGGSLAFTLSRGLDRAETRLDRGARGLGRVATLLAASTGITEHALDAGGRALSALTRRASAGTERAEQAFSVSGNLLARGIGTLGDRARGLETGKIYLYTLALFAAVLLGAGGWLLRLL